MKDREMFRLGFFSRSAIAQRAAVFYFVSFRDGQCVDLAQRRRGHRPEFERKDDPHAAERHRLARRMHLSIQRWSCTTLAGRSLRQTVMPLSWRDYNRGITPRSCAAPVGQRASHWWKLTRCIESNARRDPRSALSEVELGAPVQPANCVATRVALWPPKPNELFNTTRTFFSRATFGV